MLLGPGNKEFIRFGLVSVMGLAVDLSLAWTLLLLVDWPLIFVSGLGFLAGAMVNYVIHELWTFRHGTKKFSAARMLHYTLVLGLTLTVRLAIVALLSAFFARPGLEIFILGTAVVISFIVNYVASKFIFSR